MVEDLASLGASVAPYSGNGQLAFIMAAKQAIAVSLQAENFDFPLFTSSTLPSGTVIAVATPAIAAVVEPLPRIDSTEVALVHEETAAQPIVTAAGAVATPVRSLYQTDSVGLRLRLPISWTLRAPGAIAWMQAVTW
jgi:hypothetical protein